MTQSIKLSSEIAGPSPPAGTSQSVPTAFVGDGNAMAHIQSKKNLIEKHVLVSYNNGRTGLQYPSKSYTYDTFIKSLQIMAVDGFGADFKFNLWEGDGANYHYGLVNLALFLANCMIESIETDSCDELNWQHVSDRYAISNSCGQEGRSYQDETCRSDSVSIKYSCEVNPEMEQTASSASSESRAAPPFECISKSQDELSGYWDASSGSLFSSAPYSNSIGRTDTEGCTFVSESLKNCNLYVTPFVTIMFTHLHCSCITLHLQAAGGGEEHLQREVSAT